MKIYFYNSDERYFAPIYVDEMEEVYQIAFTYKKLVPRILAVTSGDMSALEIDYGMLLYPRLPSHQIKNLVEKYPPLPSDDNTFETMEELIIEYQEHSELFDAYSEKPVHKITEADKKELRWLETAMQAYTACENVDPNSYDCKIAEVLITRYEEKYEQPLPE